MELKINEHYLSQVLKLYHQKLASFGVNDDLRTFYIDDLDTTMDRVAYYVVNSPKVLDSVVKNAILLEDETFLEATLSVFNYLVYPDDIISDNTNGLYGYLDDAWLVYNFIQYSAHAKYLDKEELDIEWYIIDHINRHMVKAINSENYALLNQRLGRIIKNL